jgi:arsenical-resistance protein 2
VVSVFWFPRQDYFNLTKDTGSSRGRGVRAANWFAEYLEEQRDMTIKSLVLEGGIKGWATAGKDYTQLMDEYDELKWVK